MRNLLLFLLSLFLLGEFCAAQIIRVDFKSEKIAKRYKKFTITRGGETVLLGEPVPGGGVVVKDGQIQFRGPNSNPQANTQNEFFVLDPRNPEKVPYKIVDGEKEPTTRKSVCAVPGDDIERLSLFMRNEDINSLAKEYRYRRNRVDQRRESRDAEDKGTVPWFEKHRLLVVEYDRLQSWLVQISFAEAAQKLQKEVDKELKISKQEALDSRWKTAADSVHDVKTFEELSAADQEITGGKSKFHVQESQHVRFVYLDAISHDRVKKLLFLAEQLIEGFRIEFVDPYVDEEFPEQIPDGLFVEFWFGPDDATQHRRFLEEYYFRQLPYPDRVAQAAGMNFNRSLFPQMVHTWRYSTERDLEGIVCHNIGHCLACLHFNGGPMGMEQPWIEEGLAYYLSMEYTGRNSVVCKEFRESSYVRPEGKEGEKTLMLGLRDTYNRIALERGPRLDKMSLKYLHDFEDPDLAKSWSMFDWVAKSLGKEGQVWLRQGCVAARNRAEFIAEWRTASEEIFDIHGKDVFREIDERWKKYAQNEQETGESFRKRKGR